MIPAMLRIWLASGDELSPVSGKKFHVPHVKLPLRAQHGFPICLQRLIRDGVCLQDTDEVTAPAELQLVLSIDTESKQQKLKAGEELVRYAAEEGRVETTLLLLQMCPYQGYESAALVVAARKGHTEVARLLVDAGADKNALDERDGMSAVSHAASAGYAEIVRLLVDAALSAGKLLHMQFVKATLRLPDFC